jgi:hypothetical protein
VFVVGDLAYVTSYPPRLTIVDASNPSEPREVGHVGLAEIGLLVPADGPVAVHGGLAYVGIGEGVAVVDVSDPASPSLLAPPVGAAGCGGSTGLFLDDDLLYVSTTRGDAPGLYVLDASAPTDLSLAVEPLPLSSSLDVFVAGSYAYIAGERGPLVADVSWPGAPSVVWAPGEEVGEGPDFWSAPARAVFVQGDTLLVGTSAGIALFRLNCSEHEPEEG